MKITDLFHCISMDYDKSLTQNNKSLKKLILSHILKDMLSRLDIIIHHQQFLFYVREPMCTVTANAYMSLSIVVLLTTDVGTTQ